MGEPEQLEHGGREIVRVLRRAGHEAYWVGGCVRDRLLGLPVKDIDVATNAWPEEIQRLFPDVRLVGASFGVALVCFPDHNYEVATFRRDGQYVDHRRPESVEYGSLEQDARRRDFTVNALYQDPETGQVIDLVGAQEDLHARLLRTIGEPRERFTEDALRLLRAARFAARFGFEIEAGTLEAMKELAPTIRHISPERQRDELTRMLTGPNPARALRLLDEAGLLVIVLPEVAALKGVEQGADFHPEGDVYVHTLLCLENLRNPNPVSAWAMLLHDIGKPSTFERTAEGRIRFYGHEQLGARMAEDICRRFRMPNDQIRQVSKIVARHMRFMHASLWNPATMRRFLGEETIDDDLSVHRADCLSSHGNLSAYVYVSQRLREGRERQETPLPEPLLTGHDLIAMGYRPGPLFKVVLDAVLDHQMNGDLSTREEAESWVRATYPEAAEAP